MPTNASTKYIDTVKLPEAREGALLKKIYMITRATAARNQCYQTCHGECQRDI
jgi:hypothetical protein